MIKVAIEQDLLEWFDVPDSIDLGVFESSQLNDIQKSAQYNYLVAPLQGNLCLFELLVDTKIADTKKAQYLTHQIDIDSFIKQQGSSFPASKKNVFSQALGRKTKHVLDATGGWLGDSLLMCSQNYAVDVLERHWLLQGYAAQACQYLSQSEWAKTNNVSIPQVHRMDAIDYLQKNEVNADCVYIDPMFPSKVKKSAAVRKSMKVLHDMIGQDMDAEQLFEAAYNSTIKRIVVKRPSYADHLGLQIMKPTETLLGKLVRYDVYLR